MATTISTPTRPVQQKQVGTFTRVMRVFSVVLAWVLALCILLQVQIELQYFFAHAPVYVVAALHPVNAVLMFWITIHVARRSMQFVKQA